MCPYSKSAILQTSNKGLANGAGTRDLRRQARVGFGQRDVSAQAAPDRELRDCAPG